MLHDDRAPSRAAATSARGAARPARLLSADRAADAELRHIVCCPYCATQFDVFAASWCEHQEPEASKICPRCGRCLCEHPAYGEPLFWKEAPPNFQRRGFQRLFLFYL